MRTISPRVGSDMATGSTSHPSAATRRTASDARWTASRRSTSTSPKVRWRCTTPRAMRSSPSKATTDARVHRRTSRCRCASPHRPCPRPRHRASESPMPPERNPPAGSATRPVLRVERGVATPDEDHLAEEVPVAVHFDGKPFAVMMATPADLEDFARGFALTEGKVDSIADIEGIEVREVLEGMTVDVRRVWSAAEAVADIVSAYRESEDA